MSHSTGFFISAITHEVRQIHEHATAVVSDPESFGVEPSDIAGLHPKRDRYEILSMTMRAGWIRIRRRKDDMSIEFSCTWVEAIFAVAVNANLIGYGPMTFLVLRHIESGESMHTYASNVIEAVEKRKLKEFLEQIMERGVEI